MIDLAAHRFAMTGEFGVHTLDVITGTEDADTLDGTSGDDTISGLGGDDVIRASAGLDSIDGGSGNDHISVSDAGDTVHGGDGVDTIFVKIGTPGAALGGTYAGDAFTDTINVYGAKAKAVDGVTLDAGTYNDFLGDYSRGDDMIIGGDGLDMLYGRGLHNPITVDLAAGTSSGKDVGSNVLVGIEGFVGGVAGDFVTGDDGFNRLYGKGGQDTLVGGADDDFLHGGGGADTLIGGIGADSITGGGGRDTFVYLSTADSTAESTDVYFFLKKHDVIDLSAIDADVTTAGDQAFTRVGSFDGHAGQLTVTYDLLHGQTLIEGDVDGDFQADLTIQVDLDISWYDAFVL